MNKTGISQTHIYNINMGYRRKRDYLIYPIRPSNTKGTKGLKFSPEECKQIHERILENNADFKTISKEFQCSPSTIGDINAGRIKNYKLDGYNYPLRKNPKSISKSCYWENK